MIRDPAIGLSRRQADRGIYLWAALTAVMIVFAGFARTYYLKSFFGMHQVLAPLVHLHGLVMTLWFTLFAVQVWLVGSGRVALHRKLGMVGALLAALVVGVGTLTALTAVKGFPPGVGRLVVLSVTLGDLTGFVVLVPLSLVYRHCPPVHKRLILLASLSILTAAVARIPLDFINTGGVELFFCLTDLCILVCVGADTIKNRRLHPAFLWGCLFVVAEQLFRVYLTSTPPWLHFAAWLVD